jgi:hemoglobin
MHLAGRLSLSIVAVASFVLTACNTCCPSRCASPCGAAAAMPMPMPMPTPAAAAAPATVALVAKPAAAPAPKSLFDRLGGLAAIEAVVDDFLARLTADAAVTKNAVVVERLGKADAKALRQHIIDQICQATGGPCTYKGRDMKTVHTGLAITEDEWNASAADLVATLDKFKVGEAEKAELLALIVPMKGDIVGQ